MDTQTENPTVVEYKRMEMSTIRLLYDRSQETELRLAFIGLVSERHNNFHNKEVTYEECKNTICINAKMIIGASKSPDIMLDRYASELVRSFAVKFTVAGPMKIHVTLVRRDSEPKEPESLIIKP
jgi:hypothetical protein